MHKSKVSVFFTFTFEGPLKRSTWSMSFLYCHCHRNQTIPETCQGTIYEPSLYN